MYRIGQLAKVLNISDIKTALSGRTRFNKPIAAKQRLQILQRRQKKLTDIDQQVADLQQQRQQIELLITQLAANEDINNPDNK
ncbi:hypothetical protein [Rheinheimera sp. A13L]|uniref:hypothetical protein n=1 Tax=Rheinheimera sp. A13L TaxID=506534 RepID=UPI00030152CC|nr:hypothetical protein [Rheinheimera sp. A13L]